jgi:hypothetical protein
VTYDLKYCWASAKIPTDALIQDRSLDETMDAIGDFLKVETAAA